MKLALWVVLALVACEDKVAKRDEVRDEPERPAPEPRVTTPVPIDRVLADARSKAGPGQVPWRIEIDYVRSDGLIDPAFGEVEVAFTTPQRGPEDDPDRPTGAPVKPSPKRPPQCHHLSWKQGVWSDRLVGCGPSSGKVLDVRCTVPIIWERAISEGAPRDAVARLSITAGEAARWTFKIEDKVRDVRFNAAFTDDCGLVAEAPDPTVGPDSVPDAIDRQIIKNTIGTVKPDVTKCGDGTTARGVVKISVKVAPDGTTVVTVKATPDATLGDCVATAVQRAKFPATRNGGSFSYPFVF